MRDVSPASGFVSLARITLLANVIITLSVSLIFSSCHVIPMHLVDQVNRIHIPKPHVTVAYTEPKVTPDGASAYFIKGVSQESTRMVPHEQDWGLSLSKWTEDSYPCWTKFFLCRSGMHGEDPVIVSELPAGLLTYRKGITGNILWPALSLFEVSWSKREGVLVIPYGQEDCIRIIDLDTGDCRAFSWTSLKGAVKRYGLFSFLSSCAAKGHTARSRATAVQPVRPTRSERDSAIRLLFVAVATL